MANRDEERRLARAVVGGAEYVVGGWAAYEIDRRRERAAALADIGGGGRANPPQARYPPGRKYIHAHDAVHSVMSRARRTAGAYDADLGDTALVAAAKHLSAELAALEDRICEPDEDGVWEVALGHALVIPPLTSVDLAEFAASPEQQVDPAALGALAVDAARVAAFAETARASDGAAAPRAVLPTLPADTVPLGDDAAVLRLESAVAPYVSAIEDLQADVATQFERAANAVAKMARRKLNSRPR